MYEFYVYTDCANRFPVCFHTIQCVTHKYLLALYQPNQKPHARLGIIIAKHHIRLAVDRNQIRRIVRESFRHHKEELKGLDIIVLMRSKWSPLDNNALRDDINRIWQKLTLSWQVV